MNKLLIEQVAVQLEAIKETNRISCWKIGDASRDAMWQIYSSKHGLAIQTTLNKLELAIESNEEIMVGKILYSNDALNPFKKIPPDYDEYFIPSFWKSTDFKYESELRLMIDGKLSKNIQSVNLKNFDFIDYIHLSPYLMPWQTDILKRIICKYGLGSKIKLPNLTANFEPFKKV